MRSLILSVLSLILTTGFTLAQGAFGMEVRGAGSIPTSKLDNASLKLGAGFELLLHYEIIQNGTVYAGWGWNRMRSDELVSEQDIDVEETGYRFGLEYAVPVGSGPTKLYVTGGGLFNHLEFENEAGDIVEDTGHGLGWNVGFGLDYALLEFIHLRPSIKHFSLRRDMEMGSRQAEVKHEYISVGLGASFIF
jgi:hypothetical protein